MNHKFAELTRGPTQTVTRRGAPKKFGLAWRFLTRRLPCLVVAALFAAQAWASNFKLGPLIQVSKDPDTLAGCDTGFSLLVIRMSTTKLKPAWS